MMITMLFYQIPGLAMREFFNMLSGNAQLGLNIWTHRGPALRRLNSAACWVFTG